MPRAFALYTYKEIATCPYRNSTAIQDRIYILNISTILLVVASFTRIRIAFCLLVNRIAIIASILITLLIIFLVLIIYYCEGLFPFRILS